MKDREEIADALYLLRAGANPDTFMRVLRAYVIQHIQTTEHALELLRELAAVNPPAFAEAQQILSKDRKTQQANIERASAQVSATLEPILRKQSASAHEPSKSLAPSKKRSKRSAIVSRARQ